MAVPFKTIGTSDIATVAVPELKPMFSIVPVEAVILIVISVVPVIFHAKCLGFKKNGIFVRNDDDLRTALSIPDDMAKRTFAAWHIDDRLQHVVLEA